MAEEPKALVSAAEAEVADVFNNAEKASFEFDDRKYKAEVTEMRVGKFIILKLTGVDQGLVDVPTDFPRFKVRVFTIQGKVLNYPVKLMQRKLPFVVIAFPDKVEPEFSRASKRLFVKQTVLIILRKKDNVIAAANAKGMGIVTDLSPGGCSIMSKMELSKKDRVVVYLNVSETKEPVSLEVLGVVRRVAEGESGYFDYGLEWVEITDEKRGRIKHFLVSHPAAPVAMK